MPNSEHNYGTSQRNVKCSDRVDRLYRKFVSTTTGPEPKTLDDLEKRFFRSLRALKNIRVEVGDSDEFIRMENAYVDILNAIDKAESWDDVGDALDRFNAEIKELEMEALS